MSTKDSILRTGTMLWQNGSESDVSARRIGALLNISHAAVLYHFDNADHMRACIAAAAVAQGNRSVIQKLIVAGHAAVSGMDGPTRQAWLAGC